MMPPALSPTHLLAVHRQGRHEPPSPPLNPIKNNQKSIIEVNEQKPNSRSGIVNSTQLIFTLLGTSPSLKSFASSFSSSQFSMDNTFTTAGEVKRDVYSVWALPQEELTPRLKKLMEGLRSEFGGPQFEPHVTVVGAISLTESEARDMFNRACEGLKSYDVKAEKVATGSFFYQCVYLLLHPTPEVVETGAHCCAHFGYKNSTPYMPHLSLLYGDLTDEDKKTAREKAYALDDSIGSLSFQISRLALYKSDTEDKSCKSWEKVAECQLKP